MVEINDITYIYQKHFKSIYVYSDGSYEISRESLQSIYNNLNGDNFVKITKYILNIECIHKVRKKEITLNNGVLLKLSKKKFDIVRWAVHRYYHDRLH